MFTKSRKDKFVEQAQDLAHDLSEAIAPHVERARDELGPRIADARDQVAPRVAEARDQVAPRIAEVRDQVAPRIAEARDQIAPRIAEVRDQVAPHVENARDAFVKDFVPYVQKAASDARDQAAPLAEEAQRRGENAVAALKGEPVKRKGRKRKILLFAGLAGLAALAVQKLRGGNESANWQTSYSPSPAPAAPPAPVTPSAPTAGSHAADIPAAADSSDGSDDPVGATPGESLSDATEEPHPVTTPDAPAEDVDVSEVKATPKKKA
jgi:hypothetical protein